jgi:hypothetical protein
MPPHRAAAQSISRFFHLKSHDIPIKIQKSSLGNRQSKGDRNPFSVWVIVSFKI